MTDHAPKFAGVDGCRAGWIYVALDEQGKYSFGRKNRFPEVMKALETAELVLVDIPIGLPSTDRPQRPADLAARKAISPRGSSVFPAPSRSAISQSSYEAACEANARELGKKLSQQSWAIAPKIKEVDDYLRKHAPDSRIREMHPEVAFWALNGERPLVGKKKKLAGQEERLKILLRHYPSAQACYQACQLEYARNAVAKDDILDALVGAVTASCSPNLATFPPNPVFDQAGLPMEIVYPIAPTFNTKPHSVLYHEFESAAAELVGKILFALTRLEFNLGLALRFAKGNPGDAKFEQWKDSLSFKGKLKDLKDIVTDRFDNSSQCAFEFFAWHEIGERIRLKRNAFVHGRWGISHTKGHVYLMSDDYPDVGTDGPIRFSLGSLQGELDDIERIEREFGRLRTKWNSFWP